MGREFLAAWAALAVIAGAGAASAAPYDGPGLEAPSIGSIDNGRRIVTRNCARCHAVGVSGASPNKLAPPFRQLHERYPVAMIAEALAEGMLTGHPEMPVFTFQPRQIDDIIAYLNAIQSKEGDARPAGRARHLRAASDRSDG